MRVRTYGFPGCFTRPPGTSTRDHPHEPTTSKPVVPEDAAAPSSLAARDEPAGSPRCARQAMAHGTAGGTREVPADKKRRGPGPLEEPTLSGPRTFLRGWRGLTPQWPRSLRLGSASGLKVARAASAMQAPRDRPPRTFQKKVQGRDRAALSRPDQPRCGRRCDALVRRRLSLLPQWSDGQRRRLPAPARSDARPIPGPQYPLRRTAGAPPSGEPVRRAVAATRSVRRTCASASAARSPRSPRWSAKFFAAIKGGLLLLPKLKLLTTSATALVSVAAYSLFFGWPFAVGFVVLLFVHEMGHVIALRREGIKASAPMFIPFLGAAIFSKSLGDNALAEARVGLAGPILGSLGAAAVAIAGAITGSSLLLRARVHRLLHQPLQPASRRPARRRAGDGRDGAVDVVRRLRRARRAGAVAPEPDPLDHRHLRRPGDVAALEAAQDALARAGRLLPRLAAQPR